MNQEPGDAQSPPSAGGPERVTAAISAAGLVAVLRAPTADHFGAITDTLVRAGVRAIEITLSTPGAVRSIAALSRAHGSDVLIGAGTVVTADQAERCIDAGAAFLVSPAASPDVIAAARIAGVAACPGALTPTEILAAHRAGASMVKLFPASTLGPGFITAVHGPLPDIPMMPTGGIAIGDIAAWLEAGAAAVGIGGPLIGDAGVHGADAALATRAHRAVRAATAARAALAVRAGL